MRSVKIDHLVKVYNAHNAKAFADCFTPDAEVYDHPGHLAQKGQAAIRDFYTKLFDEHPQNKCDVLYKADLGDCIVSHERIHRSAAMRPFDVVAVYRFKGDLVARLDFIREHRD